MTDEDNIKTLNDILRSYINDFNNRKEYERKKKKKDKVEWNKDI